MPGIVNAKTVDSLSPRNAGANSRVVAFTRGILRGDELNPTIRKYLF